MVESEAAAAATEGETAGVAELPIRDVAQRTGVNPVTLRAWERRYGLLKPSRSGKGHRLYREADVQRIEDILTWLARGVAISKVRPLLEQDNVGPVAADSWSQQVAGTCNAVEAFDARTLQRQLRQLLAGYPLALLLDRWLVPVHRALSRQRRFGASASSGFFWEQMSEQLTIGLHASRKNLKQSGDRGPRLLLVTFAGTEQQVFAQLFAAALMAAGIDVVSLGAGVELAELAYAEEKLGACGTICYSHNALPMALLGSGLERGLGNLGGPLWFAGGIVDLQRRDLQKFARHHNCRLLPAAAGASLAQLKEALREHFPEARQ
ncbi:MerR family transcriptional regulator [Microbulbifer sp. SAOS-129_SWC]|uniref:MerR family transcriptional regulator n=1 Tax=Microbulbifer sp. SAOS-129_SWC TaxID=3145235 RepID=UPI00321686FE